MRSTLTAVGQDIYGRGRVVREIYSLRVEVRPGNSGGPLVGTDGRVLGVVFAASREDPETGYALTAAQVAAIAAAGTGRSTPSPPAPAPEPDLRYEPEPRSGLRGTAGDGPGTGGPARSPARLAQPGQLVDGQRLRPWPGPSPRHAG